jgi:hypothetical protein
MRELGKYPMQNPKRYKTWREVGIMLNSPSKSDRFHAYCTPNTCTYFGIYKNCDGTLRENMTEDTQFINITPAYGTVMRANVVPEGVNQRGSRGGKDSSN